MDLFGNYRMLEGVCSKIGFAGRIGGPPFSRTEIIIAGCRTRGTNKYWSYVSCLSVRHHDILESPLSGHFRIISYVDYVMLTRAPSRP